MSFDLRARPIKSTPFPSLLSRIAAFALLLFSTLPPARATVSRAAHPAAATFAPQEEESSQNSYVNARPYLEEPLETLVKLIPELETLQPAPAQQQLPMILEKTGEQVDTYFRNIVDLIAQEQITEEKLDPQGNVTGRLQVEDSYLILRRGTEIWGSVDEYRMDAKGEQLLDVGLNQGYFVTSNFALNHIYFSTTLQFQSRFRYLGDEQIGSHDTYVVAFAQIPGLATVPVALGGQKETGAHFLVHMLVQGIAWVDKDNSQIIRMRTDLLAPRPEIGLDSLTTTVTFSEVRLADAAIPLWLPSSVLVSAHFTKLSSSTGKPYAMNFRNEHHYSDYRSYRVSVRMTPEAAKEPVPPPDQPAEEIDPAFYANAHPYLEDPLKELCKGIPELKKVHPAADQATLPEILEKTGHNVDAFFLHVVDLIAQEKITQERLSGRGWVVSNEHVQDNYLILRHGNQLGEDFIEYRMDADGHRLDHVGLNRGYLVTTGFALISNYFSSAFQPESTFRYLGAEKIGPHDTYVVAFAQKPDRASLFVTMTGLKSTSVNMLTQGIAWVDKSTFQIVRMRTDLLAPHPEIGMDRQTTEVTFSKVQLLDVSNPLWLPSEVKVYLRFKEFDSHHHPLNEISFRNEHRYSDYRRYRVSVKMLAPQ